MISLCIFTADRPGIPEIIELFEMQVDDFEICIADNSKQMKYRNLYSSLADEYVYITDKQLFKMGIPWAHNLIASYANSYKIFYIDGDEYPVWIHPDLEKIYSDYHVPTAVRADFCTSEEILEYQHYLADNGPNKLFRKLKDDGKEISRQDRLYNSRYTKFEGICHAGFHVPSEFRSDDACALILHNKTTRKKSRGRIHDIITEQFARQNVNNNLAANKTILGWGKDIDHEYKDWREFENEN